MVPKSETGWSFCRDTLENFLPTYSLRRAPLRCVLPRVEESLQINGADLYPGEKDIYTQTPDGILSAVWVILDMLFTIIWASDTLVGQAGHYSHMEDAEAQCRSVSLLNFCFLVFISWAQPSPTAICFSFPNK